MSEPLVAGFVSIIVSLALTLLGLIVGLWLVRIVSSGAEAHIRQTYADDEDRSARLGTLLRTGSYTAKAALVSSTVLVGLSTVGIPIGPMLTAAGILGLAVSLGAQTLIKDVLGGMIILLEDQYRVGDNITVNGVNGDVEKITLRRTNLREENGDLHIVSNGDVRAVANKTRDWSRALVEINLAFDADVDKAVAALADAMTRAIEDVEITDALAEPPEILGWNQFSAWAVTVRLRAKVAPGSQWRVARVLRRYALEALHDAGVAVASRPTV
ncbi:MAG: mechanosensitive ion channel family protein [Roseiflexaceae bacterium]|nr:mechanosensitive ion channel family protein [Roseiflexaceae bacterium]